MTMWFNRSPGAFISPSTEEEGAALVGDAPPDWVKLPPELGSRQLKVLANHEAPCPKCEAPHPVRHLDLEDRYVVAECTPCGFVWYQKKA
jgi:hypothetical protein